MGVSKNRGAPKWMVYNMFIMENPIKMDDFYHHLRKHPYTADKFCRSQTAWLIGRTPCAVGNSLSAQLHRVHRCFEGDYDGSLRDIHRGRLGWRNPSKNLWQQFRREFWGIFGETLAASFSWLKSQVVCPIYFCDRYIVAGSRQLLVFLGSAKFWPRNG